MQQWPCLALRKKYSLDQCLINEHTEDGYFYDIVPPMKACLFSCSSSSLHLLGVLVVHTSCQVHVYSCTHFYPCPLDVASEPDLENDMPKGHCSGILILYLLFS